MVYNIPLYGQYTTAIHNYNINDINTDVTTCDYTGDHTGRTMVYNYSIRLYDTTIEVMLLFIMVILLLLMLVCCNQTTVVIIVITLVLTTVVFINSGVLEPDDS